MAGEVADVGQEDGHATALAPQQHLALQHLLGDLGGDVAAEDLLHAVALSEPLHHLVESGGQLGDLIAPGDLGALGEVAPAHDRGEPDEPGQRAADGPRHLARHHETDGDEDEEPEDELGAQRSTGARASSGSTSERSTHGLRPSVAGLSIGR